MSTENLVVSILNQEEDSVDSFLNILSQKIEDTLEVKKVELASTMFAEAKECPECGKPMKDCECEDEEEDDDEEEMKEETLSEMPNRGIVDVTTTELGRGKGLPPKVTNKKITADKSVIDQLVKEGYEEDKKNAPFAGPYRKASTSRKDKYGNVVKNRAAFLAKLGRAKAEKRNMKEEAEQIDEGPRSDLRRKLTSIGYGIDKATGKLRKKGWSMSKGDAAQKLARVTRKTKMTDDEIQQHLAISKKVKKEEVEQVQEVIGTTTGYSDSGPKVDAATRKAHQMRNVVTKGPRAGKITKDVQTKLKDKIKNRMMKEEPEQVSEKAPPGAKYERMVKDIKKSYSKDGTLTNKEKAIAYATAWKAKNRKGMSEEVSDTQKMSALGMKGSERSSTINALRAYRKHGDINKLSAGHRTLVTSYMEKTGGLSAVNRSAAMSALKKEKMQ
jgi:hypothetical protein